MPVGFIREQSSFVGDQDRAPETIVDALEEDLERPSRRLVLVGGHQTPLPAEDTQWESDAQFSFPTRPSELQSQFESPNGVVVVMTIGDSDEEDAPYMGMSVDTEIQHQASSDSLSDTESLSGDSEVVGEHEPPSPPEPILIPDSIRNAATRVAFASLDSVSLRDIFKQRANVMISVPQCLRGPFRAGLRLAFSEVELGRRESSEVRKERGWKLFMLLPRIFLFRPPRGGLVPKATFKARFEKFAAGGWTSLLRESGHVAHVAAGGHRRRRRTQIDSVERKAERAEALVPFG